VDVTRPDDAGMGDDITIDDMRDELDTGMN
jgi:hypothetical protein